MADLLNDAFHTNVSKNIMKPRFSTLISLTILTAVILVPFALSSSYLPIVRDRAFELYELFRGDLYKQITGYVVLALVLLEMALTLRKRGRKWKIKVPGSMMLWRSLHIFIGVALIAGVLVHTVGSTGLNFNAIFLWVFFGVSLSALIGVVAETGILETDFIQALRVRMLQRRQFSRPVPAQQTEVMEEQTVAVRSSVGTSEGQGIQSQDKLANHNGNRVTHTPPEPIFTPEGAAKLPWVISAMSKGNLIRGLRAIWLSSHIFLVSVFTIMLGFHIFLAYYYR